MKVARPAMRVFRSCTSSAPFELAEMMSRMRKCSSVSTARSISPSHRRADDVPALPEDVERDDDGKQRVEDAPAGQQRRRPGRQ